MFKGIALHLVSRLVTIFSAYVMHYLFGRVLSPAEYGIIGTVFTLTNFYYMFLNDGMKQSISKSISSGLYDNRAVIRRSTIAQLSFGVLLGVLNYLLAPAIANLYGEASLVVYFRAISLLIPITAVFVALTGVLNGLKLFLAETGIAMLYPLLRLVSVPMLGLFPARRPLGAIAGFTLAAALSLVLVLAAVFAYRKRVVQSGAAHPLCFGYNMVLKGSASLICLFAGVVGMLNMGVIIVGAFLGETASGLYTAVYMMSQVPYYFAAAFFSVLLPFVSANYAKKDTQSIRSMLFTSVYIFLVCVLPICLLLGLSAKHLLFAYYGVEYMAAAAALQLQLGGAFLISLYCIFAIVLVGMNRQRLVAAVTLSMLGVDFALHLLLTGWLGMEGASAATLISAALGMAAIALCTKKLVGVAPGVHGRLKKYRGPACLVLVFAALGVVLFGWVLPFVGLLPLLGVYAVLGLVYLCLSLWRKYINIKDLVSLTGK